MPDGPTVHQQLVVAVPTAPAALDTDRIALERAPNTMDYFARSQWTDRFPLVLQSLLVEAFERSARTPAVGREGAGLRADAVLQTDVRDFEAFYAVPDSSPEIRARIGARLVGATSHDVVAATEIARSGRARANDLANITAGFQSVTGEIVGEIVRWTLRTLSSANR